MGVSAQGGTGNPYGYATVGSKLAYPAGYAQLATTLRLRGRTYLVGSAVSLLLSLAQWTV